MTRQLLQLISSIYISILCLFLYNGLDNLHACPLPANASCTECDILTYIEETQNKSTLIVDLNVELNLAPIEHAITLFTHNIAPGEGENGLVFDIADLPDMSTSCNTDMDSGSPCTKFVKMTPEENLPNCTWNYTCDYSPHRFPQYIWRAQCASAPEGYRAQPIYYEIPTLTLKNDTNSGCLHFQDPQAVYSWKMERVQVACTCVLLNWLIYSWTSNQHSVTSYRTAVLYILISAIIN